MRRARDGKSVSVHDVTLCVLCHNGAAEIEDTLNAALTDGWPFREVIVLDNGSSDGSVEVVARCCPHARVVRSNRNLGASEGRNLLIRESASPRVLFVDHDARLTPGCSRALMAALDAVPRAVAAAPTVRERGRPDQIPFGRASAHYLGAMALLDAGRTHNTGDHGAHEMDSIVGACFLFDRSRWGTEPPFQDLLTYFFEDHDFGVRCRLLGHSVLSVAEATVFHGPAPPLPAPHRVYNPRRLRGSIRNRWALILMNYQARTLLVLAPAFGVFELAQVVFLVRRGWVHHWLSSVFWLARHLPEILRRRVRVQRARQVPDRDILSGGPIPFSEGLAAGRSDRAALRVLSVFSSLYWRIAGGWI